MFFKSNNREIHILRTVHLKTKKNRQKKSWVLLVVPGGGSTLNCPRSLACLLGAASLAVVGNRADLGRPDVSGESFNGDGGHRRELHLVVQRNGVLDRVLDGLAQVPAAVRI